MYRGCRDRDIRLARDYDDLLDRVTLESFGSGGAEFRRPRVREPGRRWANGGDHFHLENRGAPLCLRLLGQDPAFPFLPDLARQPL